jgi:hypothetical protein
MPGLVPGIHDCFAVVFKSWMAGRASAFKQKNGGRRPPMPGHDDKRVTWVDGKVQTTDSFTSRLPRVAFE